MEIHKPKPFHGWREFLKEYAIIVVGVLTALGGEQLAEHFRWEHSVGLARVSLRKEMAWNDGFFRDRLIVAPCMDRRIERASALVEEAARTGRVESVKDVVSFVGRRMETSEWEAERASQTLTHFPREELTTMGSYYASVYALHDWVAQELDANLHLHVLENGPKRLSDADIAQMRVAVETARQLESLITLNAARILDLGRRLGVKPGPTRADFVDRVCAPAGLSPAPPAA